MNQRYWVFSVIFLLLISSCTSVDNQEAARAYYNLGNAYFQLGQLNDSRKAYKRALELDDSLAAADYNLARLYLEENKFVEAENILLRLKADQPDNTIILETLGWLWYKQGDFLKSIDYYRKSVALADGNAAAWHNIGLLQLEMDNREEAESSFRLAMGYAPEKIPYRLTLAGLLISEERAQETFDLLYPAYAAGSRDFAMLTLLIKAAVHAEDFPSALEVVNAALEADADNGEFLFYKAFTLLAGFESTDEGLDFLSRSLESGIVLDTQLELFNKYPEIPGSKDITSLIAAYAGGQKKAPEVNPGADVPPPAP